MTKHVHRWTNVQIQPLDHWDLMERRERWCHTCDEYERVECLTAEGQALWVVALELWDGHERVGDEFAFCCLWKRSLLEGS